MITFLRGILAEVGDGFMDVDVNGVGYRVRVPVSASVRVHLEATVTLYTYHHIREDAQELYGFLDKQDRDWFELLLSVSGIGPKGALQIVGSADYGRFLGAIVSEDTNYLSGLPGVGKKTAQRMVLDLKDKVKPLIGTLPEAVSAPTGTDAAVKTLQGDLIDALNALGYNDRQALEAVSRVLTNNPEAASYTLETALTKCLQSMAR